MERKNKQSCSKQSVGENILKKVFLRGVLAAVIGIGLMSGRAGAAVRAAEQNHKTEVEYSYDSLGRVSRAAYPDGKLFIYTYDANGNLLDVRKETIEEEKQEGKPGEPGKPEEPGKPGESGEQGKPVGSHLPPIYEGRRPFSLQNTQGIVLNLRYTKKDVQNYNKFKKKVPKIKSLKCKVSKKKYSLSIRIQQVNARGSYGETGYEIRYSTSPKFKSFKKATVSRRKKGKYTSKSWKVKKGKTYYVKVRAYMKTKTGKKIYTKYSKGKKIKAVK